MGAIASFDWSLFSTRYPEFAYIGATLGQLYWDEATLYHSNDGTGPVGDAVRQGLMLNMLTAHVAMLNSGLQGQGASPLVGRITNASEGTVNVTVDNQYPPGTVQWYQQTKYGSAYWAAASPYRRAMFVPAPLRHAVDPWRA